MFELHFAQFQDKKSPLFFFFLKKRKKQFQSSSNFFFCSIMSWQKQQCSKHCNWESNKYLQAVFKKTLKGKPLQNSVAQFEHIWKCFGLFHTIMQSLRCYMLYFFLQVVYCIETLNSVFVDCQARPWPIKLSRPLSVGKISYRVAARFCPTITKCAVTITKSLTFVTLWQWDLQGPFGGRCIATHRNRDRVTRGTPPRKSDYIQRPRGSPLAHPPQIFVHIESLESQLFNGGKIMKFGWLVVELWWWKVGSLCAFSPYPIFSPSPNLLMDWIHQKLLAGRMAYSDTTEMWNNHEIWLSSQFVMICFVFSEQCMLGGHGTSAVRGRGKLAALLGFDGPRAKSQPSLSLLQHLNYEKNLAGQMACSDTTFLWNNRKFWLRSQIVMICLVFPEQCMLGGMAGLLCVDMVSWCSATTTHNNIPQQPFLLVTHVAACDLLNYLAVGLCLRSLQWNSRGWNLIARGHALVARGGILVAQGCPLASLLAWLPMSCLSQCAIVIISRMLKNRFVFTLRVCLQ